MSKFQQSLNEEFNYKVKVHFQYAYIDPDHPEEWSETPGYIATLLTRDEQERRMYVLNPDREFRPYYLKELRYYLLSEEYHGLLQSQSVYADKPIEAIFDEPVVLPPVDQIRQLSVRVVKVWTTKTNQSSFDQKEDNFFDRVFGRIRTFELKSHYSPNYSPSRIPSAKETAPDLFEVMGSINQALLSQSSMRWKSEDLFDSYSCFRGDLTMLQSRIANSSRSKKKRGDSLLDFISAQEDDLRDNGMEDQCMDESSLIEEHKPLYGTLRGFALQVAKDNYQMAEALMSTQMAEIHEDRMLISQLSDLYNEVLDGMPLSEDKEIVPLSSAGLTAAQEEMLYDKLVENGCLEAKVTAKEVFVYWVSGIVTGSVVPDKDEDLPIDIKNMDLPEFIILWDMMGETEWALLSKHFTLGGMALNERDLSAKAGDYRKAIEKNPGAQYKTGRRARRMVLIYLLPMFGTKEAVRGMLKEPYSMMLF